MGLFPAPGSGGGFPGGPGGAGRTRFSRRSPRGISGDSGRCTGRRSTAQCTSTAIRTANAGLHICRRPWRDQTLPVPQHIYLAE